MPDNNPQCDPAPDIDVLSTKQIQLISEKLYILDPTRTMLRASKDLADPNGNKFIIDTNNREGIEKKYWYKNDKLTEAESVRPDDNSKDPDLLPSMMMLSLSNTGVLTMADAYRAMDRESSHSQPRLPRSEHWRWTEPSAGPSASKEELKNLSDSLDDTLKRLGEPSPPPNRNRNACIDSPLYPSMSQPKRR